MYAVNSHILVVNRLENLTEFLSLLIFLNRETQQNWLYIILRVAVLFSASNNWFTFTTDLILYTFIVFPDLKTWVLTPNSSLYHKYSQSYVSMIFVWQPFWILLSTATCLKVRTPHPPRYYYIDPKPITIIREKTSTFGTRFTPTAVGLTWCFIFSVIIFSHWSCQPEVLATAYLTTVVIVMQ